MEACLAEPRSWAKRHFCRDEVALLERREELGVCGLALLIKVVSKLALPQDRVWRNDTELAAQNVKEMCLTSRSSTIVLPPESSTIRKRVIRSGDSGEVAGSAARKIVMATAQAKTSITGDWSQICCWESDDE